jgi:hypothetical protein
MNDFPIIQKPPYRSPCNRCGECCKVGPCDLAIDFLQADDGELCPALEVEPDGRFSCGLFKRPIHYINPQLAAEAETINGWTDFPAKVAEVLGFGQGCSMEDGPRVLSCKIPEWA